MSSRVLQNTELRNAKVELRRNETEATKVEKIRRFFECLIPVTACNLKCSYCYVIQRDRRKMKMADLKYTPEQMGEALTKERLGGICYFSICGAGETTMQPEIADIVYHIMKHGHYVNITTNGTVTKKIDEILERGKDFTDRLHFAFSFHYLELVRLNLMDRFFDNVKKVREAGCSFLVQINLCDDYLPHLDEIKRLCIEHTGAMPQVAATRKEETGLRKIELLTELTEEEYIKAGKTFDSPLFDFTMKNFNVPRKEFCYAGDWSGNLDLSTGILRRCYCSYLRQDIFKNPKEPIRFLAIGNMCGSAFCMNSSHFMSLGVIPEVETPTYAELRNRKEAGWYTPQMEEALSGKLEEANELYSPLKKAQSNAIGAADNAFRLGVQMIRKRKKRK